MNRPPFCPIIIIPKSEECQKLEMDSLKIVDVIDSGGANGRNSCSSDLKSSIKKSVRKRLWNLLRRHLYIWSWGGSFSNETTITSKEEEASLDVSKHKCAWILQLK